ncbi:MAG: tetratricopeptide repeat protein [Elusimicrobiota bacterium]
MRLGLAMGVSLSLCAVLAFGQSPARGSPRSAPGTNRQFESRLRNIERRLGPVRADSRKMIEGLRAKMEGFSPQERYDVQRDYLDALEAADKIRAARRQGDKAQSRQLARQMRGHLRTLQSRFGAAGGDMVALSLQSEADHSRRSAQIDQSQFDFAREAAQAFPEHAGVQRGLADLLLRTRDPEGAISAYARSAQLDPKNAQAFVGMADARYQMKDYEGAYRDARQALELDPTDIAAKTVVKLVRAAGNFSGAIVSPTADLQGHFASRSVSRASGDTDAKQTPLPEKGLIIAAPPMPTKTTFSGLQPSEEHSEPGVLRQAYSWVRLAAKDSEGFALSAADETLGIKPSERQVAKAGAKTGKAVGFAAGSIGSAYVGGTSFCTAGVVLGMYWPCVAAAFGGGGQVGAPLGAYAGASGSVVWNRFWDRVDEIFVDNVGIPFSKGE